METKKQSLSEILPESIFNKVHECIGQASMCWENIEAAGVFKSEMALKIAEDLLWSIAEYKQFVIAMEESFKKSQEKVN